MRAEQRRTLRVRFSALPASVRWAFFAATSLLALAPVWRGYAAWWDLWNGHGAFCAQWLPVAR